MIPETIVEDRDTRETIGFMHVRREWTARCNLKPPTVDSRRQGSLLVMLLIMACNLAYLSAYIVTIHRRLVRKTKRLLYVVGRIRGRRDELLDENAALNRRLLDSERDIEQLQSQLRNSEAAAEANRKALELVQNGVSASTPPTVDTRFRDREDDVYELKSTTRIARYPYRDIARFTINESVISLQLVSGESIVTTEESLASVIRKTDGYFRNNRRDEIIAWHMVGACFSEAEGRLKLILKHSGGARLVSKTFADAMRDWVLEAVKEIRIDDE